MSARWVVAGRCARSTAAAPSTTRDAARIVATASAPPRCRAAGKHERLLLTQRERSDALVCEWTRRVAMRTLIKGGTVVNADGSTQADVLVDGETIAAVGRDLGASADQTIDAGGKYVIPGAIDVHTHMELPFGGTFAKDTFETGTRAAAFGGTTTIIDFAVQSRGKSLREGLDAWRAKAEGNADDRLRLPHDHVGRQRRHAGRDGQAGRRRRHRLQALYGLPRRLLLGRRRHLPGHAANVDQRRPDHDARRERHGHRRRRRRVCQRRA